MAFNIGDGEDDNVLADINVTPLVDVMLVLLIIFMAPLLVLPIRFIGRHLRRRSRELQQTLGELTERAWRWAGVTSGDGSSRWTPRVRRSCWRGTWARSPAWSSPATGRAS